MSLQQELQADAMFACTTVPPPTCVYAVGKPFVGRQSSASLVAGLIVSGEQLVIDVVRAPSRQGIIFPF